MNFIWITACSVCCSALTAILVAFINEINLILQCLYVVCLCFFWSTFKVNSCRGAVVGSRGRDEIYGRGGFSRFRYLFKGIPITYYLIGRSFLLEGVSKNFFGLYQVLGLWRGAKKRTRESWRVRRNHFFDSINRLLSFARSVAHPICLRARNTLSKCLDVSICSTNSASHKRRCKTLLRAWVWTYSPNKTQK